LLMLRLHLALEQTFGLRWYATSLCNDGYPAQARVTSLTTKIA
jgi:hypothetical protein